MSTNTKVDETEKMIEGIEKTRSEMSGAMAALESRLSPDHLRVKVQGELHHVEDKVREVVKEHLAEAKTLMENGLAEARVALKQDLAEELDITEAKIRKGLVDAKDTVKGELREAITGATRSVRAATLGKVEDLATTIGDTMNNTRETLVDTVRNNPLPAAVAGIGIAWLLMNRSASRRGSGYANRAMPSSAGRVVDDFGRSMQHATEVAGDAVGKVAHRVTDAASSAAHQASDAMGTAASFASTTASSIAQGASDVAGRVAHGADDAAHYLYDGAGAQARRAGESFQTALQENPLALGAAAVVIGGVIGYALPRTHAEDMLMGEAHAQLMSRAEEATSGAAEKVGEFAQKTVDTAKDMLAGATGNGSSGATASR